MRISSNVTPSTLEELKKEKKYLLIIVNTFWNELISGFWIQPLKVKWYAALILALSKLNHLCHIFKEITFREIPLGFLLIVLGTRSKEAVFKCILIQLKKNNRNFEVKIYVLLLYEQKLLIYIFIFGLFLNRLLMKQTVLTSFEDKKSIWLGLDLEKTHLNWSFLN